METKNNLIKIICITVSIFISIVNSSCQTKKMEEKFDWESGLSAPKEYPIEVYEGWLIAGDYVQSFKNFGIHDNGWGEEGRNMGGGTKKPVPDSLDICWRSFIENKFYKGVFTLPKEKIMQLFQEGFINDYTKKKETYNAVIVGMAPGGKVVVWLSGMRNQVEVGSYQAKEINLTINDVGHDDEYMFRPNYMGLILNDTSAYGKPVRDKIKKDGYPPISTYEAYRQKFNWKPVIILPEGDTIIKCVFDMFNGEMEDLFDEPLLINAFKLRAIPKIIYFLWNTKNGKKYVLRMNSIDESFNEKEIFELFKQIDITDKNAQIQLVFKINSDYKNATIFLKYKTIELPFKQVGVNVFEK